VYTALRATSKTLVTFLQNRFHSDPVLAPSFTPSGNMQVSLSIPEDMTDRGDEGLSVWLYRVVRDEERVNAPYERISSTQLRRPPLPLRLHYLITPVINTKSNSTPETEQAILGKVMQSFYEHSTFRGSELMDGLLDTQSEITVRLETLSLDDIAKVYDALNRSYGLSISYEVTVVYIYPSIEPESVTPVQVVMPDVELIVAEAGG
jgi:hypothetical protein